MEAAVGDAKTRLMISNMELENFKSYAGAQRIGPFHKSFTSVVGPNGSGKSNVIDALLFVFGKKAKQLRLNNISELIHKSANYPNFEYTTVSVFFQLIKDSEESEDEFEVIPGSEFVISRTAYTNNSSKYFVDGKKSTYTEVGQLLRKFGVDLDNNRFLILQGEVEQIAMMKPKGNGPNDDGLLEYLEDIIGSNQFIEAINQSFAQLESLNDDRVEKVNKVKIAEKDRDNLLESKLEAEALLAKEKEIRFKKNILFQLNEREVRLTINDLTAKQAKIQNKLQANHDQLSVIKEESNEMAKEYASIKSEHAMVEKELAKSTTQYHSFERRDIKLQEELKHIKTSLKKHHVTITKEEKKLAELHSETEALTVQIDKYRGLLADFESRKVEEENALSEIMSSLQDGTKDLRVALEQAQQGLSQAEKAASSLQTEKDLTMNAMSLIRSRLEKLELLKVQVEEKLHVTHQSIAQEEEKVSQYQAFDAKNAMMKLTAKLTQCEAQEGQISSQMTEATINLEAVKNSLQVQEQRDSLHGAVGHILKASRLGGVLSHVGIRGRLGDLATISDVYDVAMTTACKQLDHIVVNDSEGAMACVDYLRSQNLGRASFIILSQLADDMKEKMNRKPVKIPGNTSRLFDLITVDSEDLKPAFYLALRDTLVAETLDSAVTIAYDSSNGGHGNWRVVTVDGQVIDVSGAMSGGGREVRKGGMRLASASSTTAASKKGSKKTSQSSKTAAASEEDHETVITSAMIKTLEGELSSLSAQLTLIREEKAQIETQISSLKTLITQNETALQKSMVSLTRFQEQEEELRSRLLALTAECNLTPAEKQELAMKTRLLTELEVQITQISPNLHSFQSEVSSLTRQMKSFGGPRLAQAQAKVDSIHNQIATLLSSISTKEVELTQTQSSLDKTQMIITKTQSEIEKCEEKNRALEVEKNEMENDAMELMTLKAAAETRLAELTAELSSRSSAHQTLESRLQTLKSEEIDLKVDLDKLTAEVKNAMLLSEEWSCKAEMVRQVYLEEEMDLMRTIHAVTTANASANTASTATASAIAAEEENTEMPAVEPLPVFTQEELQSHAEDMDEIKRSLAILESGKQSSKASDINTKALVDYLKKDHIYRLRLKELEAVNEARVKVKEDYEGLRRKRLELFMSGFGVISLRLKEMYQMITLGGDAELELLDSLDPFSEGISFSVRPPKKSWKQIGNLSGGEKTLSSLALVFALHHFKPTPLYVMDEIDAALDFKNVSIVANYIKERTRDAQFIIISLRNNMFELADRLVGIYKTKDATKSVALNPKLFAAMPSANDEEGDSAGGERMALGDVTNKVR